MEEERSRKTHSSAARVVHSPPLHRGSDGYALRRHFGPSRFDIFKLFFVDFVTFVMLCCKYSYVVIFLCGPRVLNVYNVRFFGNFGNFLLFLGY